MKHQGNHASATVAWILQQHAEFKHQSALPNKYNCCHNGYNVHGGNISLLLNLLRSTVSYNLLLTFLDCLKCLDLKWW